MNTILRVGCGVNRTYPANPKLCGYEIQELLQKMAQQEPDVMLFPSLALSSPSCGALFRNATLLDACQEQLSQLQIASKEQQGYLFVGLPLRDGGTVRSALAVLRQGQLLGYLPTQSAPQGLVGENPSQLMLPMDTLFACGELKLMALGCSPLELPLHLGEIQRTGCDLVLLPCYHPVRAGELQQIRRLCKTLSQALGIGIAVANGGAGDTSHPDAFQGYAGVWECGQELCFQWGYYDSFSVLCDVDADILHANKMFTAFHPVFHAFPGTAGKRGLLRKVEQNPYLPQDPQEREAYLDHLFHLQASSLAKRMSNTGLGRLVLGVSGGLDSTLALLVGVQALQDLNLPRDRLTGITMPGFGTSDRTYYNALALLEALQVRQREISIRACVTQHLADIGQDPDQRDVTYENAQARERCQILLDVANQENALVIGTGDLSEEALGWCTFGGDHLASYNVNSCITKTVVRALVEHCAQLEAFAPCREILQDILDTPVSPELLPPDETGEITQKTEDILGPYLLHEFFLYYLVKYGFRPAKLYYYACIAFSTQLEPAFIREKLKLFLRRFVTSQFKRSCTPDAAQVTDVSPGAAFPFPSDCGYRAFLDEVDSIHF